MEYFVSISKFGTMLEATKTLNVSQSTLSMSMKKLENELGSKLFIKSGRRLRLTSTGELFLEGAIKILDDAALLKKSIICKNDAYYKSLVVTNDATDFAVEAISIYHLLKPRTEIKQIRAQQKALHTQLLSRQADFCISLNPIQDVNVESLLLLSEPMLLLVSNESCFAKMKYISIASLVNETLITMDEGYAIQSLFKSYYAIARIKPKSILVVGEQEVLAMSASRGFGITFIPRSVWNMIKENGHDEFAAIPIQESFCFRNIYLSRLKRPVYSSEHEHFFNFMIGFAEKTSVQERLPNINDYR